MIDANYSLKEQNKTMSAIEVGSNEVLPTTMTQLKHKIRLINFFVSTRNLEPLCTVCSFFFFCMLQLIILERRILKRRILKMIVTA